MILAKKSIFVAWVQIPSPAPNYPNSLAIRCFAFLSPALPHVIARLVLAIHGDELMFEPVVMGLEIRLALSSLYHGASHHGLPGQAR